MIAMPRTVPTAAPATHALGEIGLRVEVKVGLSWAVDVLSDAVLGVGFCNGEAALIVDVNTAKNIGLRVLPFNFEEDCAYIMRW